MELTDGGYKADGKTQEPAQVHRLPNKPIESSPRGPRGNSIVRPSRRSERNRLRCPIGIEFFPDRVLVLQLLETPNRWTFGDGLHLEEPGPVVLASAPVQRELTILP